MDSLAFISFWTLDSITWLEGKSLLKMLQFFFPQKRMEKGTKIKMSSANLIWLGSWGGLGAQVMSN